MSLLKNSGPSEVLTCQVRFNMVEVHGIGCGLPFEEYVAGCNFGDEGLFFLAESLGYNQVYSYRPLVRICCLPTSLLA